MNNLLKFPWKVKWLCNTLLKVTFNKNKANELTFNHYVVFQYSTTRQLAQGRNITYVRNSRQLARIKCKSKEAYGELSWPFVYVRQMCGRQACL